MPLDEKYAQENTILPLHMMVVSVAAFLPLNISDLWVYSKERLLQKALGTLNKMNG